MIKLGCSLLLLLNMVACSVVPNTAELSDIITTPVTVRLSRDGREIETGSAVLIACQFKTNSIQGSFYELLFLTAHHVLTSIDPSVFAQVEFSDGSKFVIKEIIPYPKPREVEGGLDIAMFTALSEFYIKPATLDPAPPRRLEPVYAAGTPLGVEPSISTGIIGRRSVTHPYAWVCSAPIFLGSSGGPVIRASNGKIMGITIQIMAGRLSEYGYVFLPNIHIFLPTNLFYDWVEEVKNERADK